MVYESFGVLLAFALLGLIGLGPALHLVPGQPKQLQYALAISPALGFAILEILGLGLVRYFAPVETWALVLAAILIVASGILALLWWRERSAAGHKIRVPWRSLVPAILFFFGCFLILASPMIFMGLQYAIFRSNSSDAFTYISLAETLRNVPWQVIVNGIQLTPENAAGVQQLASASPSALLTARMVGLPLQLNNMVLLAWFGQVTRVPVYAAYFPFHVLAFVNALVLSFVLGDMLGLKRWLKYLAAATVALGFWARFILETDAGFEIISIPLLLLVAIAWIQQEEHAPTRLFSLPRLLLAVGLTALLVNYLIMAGLVAVAFLIYYLINLLRRQRSFLALVYQGMTALLVLVLLTITGQIDFQLLNLVYGLANIQRQGAFEATVWNVWAANGLSAIWGMGTETLMGAQRALVRLPIQVLSNVFALVLTALILVAGWLSFFKTRYIAPQVIFSLVFAGLILMLWALVGGNLRAAGKAFTYVYPYIVLGLAIATLQAGAWRGWLQTASVGAVTLWFVVQITLGMLIPYTNIFSRVFTYPRRNEAYDLSAITRVLDSNPPNLLLVSVPRTNSWEFPYYVSLVFGQYPSHFSSGLVVDNSARVRNVWTGELATAPDYAVLFKQADSTVSSNLGEPLAETRDLALYQITPDKLELLQAQERELVAQDREKPIFQHTLPLLFGVR